MENIIYSIKTSALIPCGTCLALYQDRHGAVCGKSSLSNKRMHGKGGGWAEFGKHSGEEKLLNHRVAARKVDLAPENSSNCFWLQAENKKIMKFTQNNSLAGSELKTNC